MSSRRILITGLSSHLGGRLAQALEREPDVASIVGVDTADPLHELQRTEFVRVEIEPGLLRRILNAAAIDTVIDTRLLTNPLVESLSRAHEVNVAGTQAIVEACSDRGSSVRKLVFKSSAHFYGWGPGDPAFLREDMSPRRAPETAIERDVVEAEAAVQEFAARHPDCTVTVLRLADQLDGHEGASRAALLSLPVIPSMLGFDPRCQFVHEDDVVGGLAFAARHDLPGVYNVAGDGVLVLSEVISLLGKTMLPVLPPWGMGFAAAQLRRLGLRVPVETIRHLRYGRGLDNRRLKAAGYAYRYTSREAVLKVRAGQRLRPLLQTGADVYRYEPEVEEFLRWSPSVQAADTRAAGQSADTRAAGRPAATRAAGRATDNRAAPGPRGEGGSSRKAPRRPRDASPMRGYDQLSDGELIDIIASLEPEALSTLRRYEATHQARGAVLEALDRTLARKGPRKNY